MKFKFFSGFFGLITGSLGSLLLFRALFFADFSREVWSDNFDSILLAWTFEWGYHILFQIMKPLDFFQANSFFPHESTLAYSDSLLSAQIFYSPLRYLGIERFPAIYLTLAGVCILGAVLSDFALARLNYSALERVFIIWGAHFCLPMTSFFGHYQLFGFQLAPPFLLYLYIYLTTLNVKDAAKALAIFSFSVLFAVYLAPMLFALSVLLAALLLPQSIIEKGFLKCCKQLFSTVLMALVFGFVIYILQFKTYFALESSFPKQAFTETALYSAKWHSLLTGFSINSFWYSQESNYSYGDWERAFFPGYLLICFSCLFILLCSFRLLFTKRIYREKKPSHLSLEKIRTSFILGVLVICLILSVGPYFQADPEHRLPFYYLSYILPGLRSIRAPGRFGILLGLPLALSAIHFLRVLSLRGLWSKAILSTALILLIVESIPWHQLKPISYPGFEKYAFLSSVIPEETPVVEIPSSGKDHFDTLNSVMAQLYGSTYYWGRLVLGYGGKSTQEFSELIALDQALKNNPEDVKPLLTFCSNLGIQRIILRKDRLSKEIIERILLSLSANGLTNPMYVDDIFIVFTLKEPTTRPPPLI